ncbi:Holliday junction branch migration protein RuvA [Prochlorococcus marinus]|uniref:Holliday junction branch migration complex subunit RuvA n=1 Tax=Prochlorococcus marinus (strain MIT 9211) TaxID=93059 RepID=RUVA_PROM4|nr:Holliday junction branch migration protein RuvA [Prochlorococcus marinus]A9B9X1.1 RecName: Full=Holliday junction branch migration complex subunit RuvA [Prochlorococcus marinus str. MIT 9211]ABX08633.1 putative holliday junction DNA helicase RuvA [Prochlorococcus marinus str. MIT 9211]
MIGWLKGEKIDHWNNGNRAGFVLSCNGVGYEIQLSRRNLIALNNYNVLSIWIHQVLKEDGSNLFGFIEKSERDLFRKLITVSGVGPQLAMSLLDDNSYEQLIANVQNKEVTKLTRSSGVGKRTAERLILELQNKLSDFDLNNEFSPPTKLRPESAEDLNEELLTEIKSALRNLDYSDFEILEAVNTVTSNYLDDAASANERKLLLKSLNFEKLFKQALITLNK